MLAAMPHQIPLPVTIDVKPPRNMRGPTQRRGRTTKPFVSWLCLTISTLSAGTLATAASACQAL
jgi:hypothetical protein